MPTYEFRCPKGHEFERFYRTISGAASEVACPECGATATRKISGGAGFAFKGSGFYLTDYGKNAHRGDKQVSAKDGSSKDGSSKDGSAKPEATPKADAPKAQSPEPKAEKPKAQSPKPKAE